MAGCIENKNSTGCSVPTDTPFHSEVNVTVKDPRGSVTSAVVPYAEYFYPHEIPDIKVKDLEDVRKKLGEIEGDPNTVFKKLPDDYKRLNCIFAVWGPDDIIDSDSSLGVSLSDDDRTLINHHKVIVYAAFVDSTKLWDKFNDEVLRLRPEYRILRGGLQMASDFMVQGELITIPLTRAIGYQNNTHVLVHFTNGNPDLGRKTFQSEYHDLAERLAAQSVKALTRYRSLLRPNTGIVTLAPDKELYEWKKEQESWRDSHSITLGHLAPNVTMLSEPQQEQDVIALFHQLVGSGLIKGLHFFGTTSNDRYDSLIEIDYPDTVGFRFNRKTCSLGVGSAIDFPYKSEPKVLEYKYDLDALISDLQKEEKFLKHIDLVVCWTAGGGYSSMLELRPLLVGDNGQERLFYGSTHAAYRVVGGEGSRI